MSKPQRHWPIQVGLLKCGRKGHRPLNKYDICTRCGTWVR